MKTINLRGLADKTRDAHVNAAVAEHVAGFVWAEDTANGRHGAGFTKGTIALVEPGHVSKELSWKHPTKAKTLSSEAYFRVPRYANHAEEVLPHLARFGWKGAGNRCGGTYSSTVCVLNPETKQEAKAFCDDTQTRTPFALAGCIALLRAVGWEILT